MTARRAWLQKHPSPVARDGAFHWYPAGEDAELRAGFAERLSSVTVPVVLWHHAPGRIAWASAFAATAPCDGRNYVGLAMVVVEGAGSTAELLAGLVPPIAAPWAAGADLARPPRRAETDVELPDTAAVVRALLGGGSAALGELARAGLPRAVAALERVLPPDVTARARAGTWIESAPPRGPDRVATLAAAAVASPRSRAAAAWRLLVELARATGRDVDALAAEAERDDTRATDPERIAALADNDDWLATLNAWGRGRLARGTDELADRVALRAFTQLAADRDPALAIAEVRWRALLPAPRRTELLTAVVRRTASLRGYVDA